MSVIIIATKNEGKAKEFKEIFKKYGLVAKSLLDFPESFPDVEETGKTFAENAQLKAEQICSYTEKPVIADDSGLVIDALDGRPGIYSARYAGTDKNDHENMKKVLEELKDIPKEKRTARFVCSLAIARPDQKVVMKEEYCEGRITTKPIGTKGFGYDPIFIPEGFTQTMAQLTSDIKNKISHRGKAIQVFEKWMKNNKIY